MSDEKVEELSAPPVTSEERASGSWRRLEVDFEELTVTVRSGFGIEASRAEGRRTLWSSKSTARSGADEASKEFPTSDADTTSPRPDAILGEGSFGVVTRGRFRERDVAVKCITSIAPAAPSLPPHCHELQLLHELRDSPHIVQLLAFSTHGDFTWIVMELATLSTLHDAIHAATFAHAHVEIPLHIRIAWILDVASALLFMHERNVLHRDVKPANVILFSGLRAKLCDFGLARREERRDGDRGRGGERGGVPFGTLEFRAPELRSGASATRSSDMYAWLALAACTVLVHVAPTTFVTNHAFLLRTLSVVRLPQPVRALITRCNNCTIPDDRPSAQDAVDALSPFARSRDDDASARFERHLAELQVEREAAAGTPPRGEGGFCARFCTCVCAALRPPHLRKMRCTAEVYELCHRDALHGDRCWLHRRDIAI